MREAATPTLRFTPDAWAKLLFFCHYGETEIGGFGVSSADDPLRIEQFITIKQHTTAVTVAFDDAAVADHFDAQVDEETFARVFGACDWAVMFILARGGETYCRLRFNVGPGGSILIPVGIDYTRAFHGSDQNVWADEYERNVHVEPLNRTTVGPTSGESVFDELCGNDVSESAEAYDFPNDECEVLNARCSLSTKILSNNVPITQRSSRTQASCRPGEPVMAVKLEDED